ncbi:MAG: protein-disulfide reductase DsbD domain-containing protein [Opitutaceae bacterium]|jgi:thiol:disulfide interchange protein DsbD
MILRSPLLLLALAFSVFAPAARAQVEASLIAADQSVQPGHAFTVALRLAHEPHWHSYWINPGTGYPTSLTWKLPSGWQASALKWPVPHVVRDTTGMVTGNGYEGVVYLPVTITPPADLKPGETVTLSADAKWLMCAEVCVPGKASVSIELPVLASAPQPSTHSTDIATALASLPREATGITVRASLNGKIITLALTRSADSPLPHLAKPWFFSTDETVQFDQPQSVRSSNPDETTLDLPLSPNLTEPPTRLTGVLRLEADDGSVTGITLDTPIGAIAASSSSPSPLDARPSTPAAATPLAGTLTLAFVGGLILNLMPCVFPVLGIKILGFVNQAGADRRKVTLHGLAFAGGVLLSFWTLAGALAAFRAGGAQLGWGFQLQSPGFVFVLAAVMLVFALSMSGVFEFGLRATGVGAGLQMKDGFAGSFFTGVLATVVATPCSAPFLAPALGAALALPVIQSFAVFTAIAIGLALPYLLLSIFPQAVKALPRPGAWMETFKQAMAFPLYATVGYLLWVLAGQLKNSDTALLAILLGLTVIAMGTWLYGRYAAPGSKPARARFGLIGGLILLTLGAWLGWPRPPAPTHIQWQPWSAEAVTKAVAEGHPVYVDFTARWCFTCQTNKKLVFGSDEVLKTFRDKGVVTLRGDWTDEDPLITAELARWNRSAVPFNLVYLPGKPAPIILPELLTPGIVLDALKPAR